MYGTVSRHLSRCRGWSVHSVKLLPKGLECYVVGSRGRDGAVQPHLQGCHRPEYAKDPVPPHQECKLQNRVVHLEADALCASDFPDHPGGLPTCRGRRVVKECTHERHCRLLALCRHLA